MTNAVYMTDLIVKMEALDFKAYVNSSFFKFFMIFFFGALVITLLFRWGKDKIVRILKMIIGLCQQANQGEGQNSKDMEDDYWTLPTIDQLRSKDYPEIQGKPEFFAKMIPEYFYKSGFRVKIEKQFENKIILIPLEETICTLLDVGEPVFHENLELILTDDAVCNLKKDKNEYYIVGNWVENYRHVYPILTDSTIFTETTPGFGNVVFPLIQPARRIEFTKTAQCQTIMMQ